MAHMDYGVLVLMLSNSVPHFDAEQRQNLADLCLLPEPQRTELGDRLAEENRRIWEAQAPERAAKRAAKAAKK